MKNKIYFSITLIFLFIIIIIFLLINPKNSVNSSNNDFQTDTIIVLVDVYIIKYNDQELSSTRDEENILDVFENVNNLWRPANIYIEIIDIENVTVNDDSYFYDLNSILSYMIESGNYNPNRINAYFAQTLHGSNGIAFPGNRIMVADRTSVYDYRATSHEIGHVLGLVHVGPVSRLMARGVNGFDLIEQEINIARKNALRLFN